MLDSMFNDSNTFYERVKMLFRKHVIVTTTMIDLFKDLVTNLLSFTKYFDLRLIIFDVYVTYDV